MLDKWYRRVYRFLYKIPLESFQVQFNMLYLCHQFGINSAIKKEACTTSWQRTGKPKILSWWSLVYEFVFFRNHYNCYKYLTNYIEFRVTFLWTYNLNCPPLSPPYCQRISENIAGKKKVNQYFIFIDGWFRFYSPFFSLVFITYRKRLIYDLIVGVQWK